MNILIKGMDIPKSEDQTICLIIDDFGQVFKQVSSIEFEKAGTAIQISTPHGGLIDRSVLFKEYQNLCNGLLCRDCPFFNERNSCNIEEWILNQPTILEAEE